MAQQPKQLYRSRTDRKLAGVLGGVAEYIGVDPSFVRILYAVVTFFTMAIPGVLLYLAMAFIIPEGPEVGDQTT